MAADLFDALQGLHMLPPDAGRLLESAAYLHNVGHYISDTGHDKHSAYIVSNSDMPGYTDRERHIVALLCRYHRKSMPTPRHDVFRDAVRRREAFDSDADTDTTGCGRVGRGASAEGAAAEAQTVNNAVNVSVHGEGDHRS